MLEIKNERIAIPIVLFAGLLWSFGPLVVRYMDQPNLNPWQYLFTRGIVIFIILLINRSISKVIKYSGIGSLDKFFGFLFGFVRSYVIAVCIFTTVNIVYNYNRWPINLDKSFSFEWVEKGSSFLIREFPSKKEHEETKEKIKNI